MDREKKNRGLLRQVMILFIAAVLVTGGIVYAMQRITSERTVRRYMEYLSVRASDEVILAVQEYPAYRWLLRYWYENAYDLDIEYDVGFGESTETLEKCRILAEHYPGLQIRYVSTQDIVDMTPEDRKLYAEVAYSWLITRINEIKQAYGMDFLFCAVADEPYDTQFFLFSAADPGATRGTEYEQVYTLGTVSAVGKSLQKAMREAKLYEEHLADAGKYMDCYKYFEVVDGHALFIGITYNQTGIKADIMARTIRGTAVAMLGQLILSLACLILMDYVVLNPLSKVQQNIRLYEQTKDSAVIRENLSKIRSRNEIGQLSEEMINLTEEIDDHLDQIRRITAETERIGVELSLASRIQNDALPQKFPAFPDRTEFDLYASMNPAREVGGNFYDFFLVDDDHLCLVMADVSGKGVPGALFMMISKTIIANNAMQENSAAEILRQTNETICANNRAEMFVTAWVGILEISTGRLTAANAGHEYPVIRNTDGAFTLLKDRHGFVLGGMDGVNYTEYEIRLQPGAKLFIYTDGVTEATDEHGNMFGTARLLDALNIDPQADPMSILRNVHDAVDLFVQDAEQFDDLTMLCMEYKGPAEG